MKALPWILAVVLVLALAWWWLTGSPEARARAGQLSISSSGAAGAAGSLGLGTAGLVGLDNLATVECQSVARAYGIGVPTGKLCDISRKLDPVHYIVPVINKIPGVSRVSNWIGGFFT